MKINLENFVLSTVTEMQSRKQYCTAKTCISAFHGLSAIAQHKPLTFSDITPELLTTFEHQLITTGRSLNTVSLYMRTLKNLCNRARQKKVATLPNGLFENVFTGAVPVSHRAISSKLIRQINDLKLIEKQMRLRFSRDMFILCFYLRGISYIDLSRLRKSDLKNGVITYCRQKTKKPTSLKLEPCAIEIIERYAHLAANTVYLLPIIRVQGTAKEERKQYESALRLHNKHLNQIGVILKLKMPLTSYVARHSWATIAHDIGVEMADISQALCHSSEKMTQNYIRSFTTDRLEGVNQKVITYVIGTEEERATEEEGVKEDVKEDVKEGVKEKAEEKVKKKVKEKDINKTKPTTKPLKKQIKTDKKNVPVLYKKRNVSAAK